MTYLRRKIDTFLEQWYNNIDRLPLVIKGARQIGKTSSIQRFAKMHYENVVYINFVEEPKYKYINENGYSAQDVIKAISLRNNEFKFIPKKTIIIFDEIQEFPEICTSLKFFKIDGRFDVICTGSLLGIHYKKIESISVGYKQDYIMRSMDFEEFLWAKGYEEEIIEDILNHMINIIPFSKNELDVYESLFMDYCIIGGMPNVVRNYIEKNTFEGVLQLQKSIIDAYKEDIQKYVEGLDKKKVLSVFNQVPSQLAKENKKFQYSLINKNARSKEYFGCIDWLSDAGIINICYSLAIPALPIKGNQNYSSFKLYVADTGLLISMLDEESQIDLKVNKNFGIYKGGVFENIVAEAICKQGKDPVYYKKANSTLEIDFFLRNQKNLVPIEVKSSNNKAQSLSSMISSDKYSEVEFGVKLIKGNIGFSNNIYTFPYFCAFLINDFLKSLNK